MSGICYADRNTAGFTIWQAQKNLSFVGGFFYYRMEIFFCKKVLNFHEKALSLRLVIQKQWVV